MEYKKQNKLLDKAAEQWLNLLLIHSRHRHNQLIQNQVKLTNKNKYERSK